MQLAAHTSNRLPVAISKHTVGIKKEANIRRYSLDNWNQEAIWAEKQYEETWIFCMKLSPAGGCGRRRLCCLRHRLAIAASSPDFSNDKSELLLFLFLSFLSWLFTERGQRGVEVSWIVQAYTTDALWLWMVWSLLCLARCRENSSVGVLESALPLGSNITMRTFWCLLHTVRTFFLCDSSKQEPAMSRGNCFL